MTTNYDVAACARGYIGTPFHHQGRLKGGGIDCAGLIICVAHELNISSFDIQSYTRTPNPRVYLSVLNDNLDEDTTGVFVPGQVLSFAFARYQQHLGITVTSTTMVHAIEQHLTHELTLSETWIKRLRGVWRYRGVTYG